MSAVFDERRVEISTNVEAVLNYTRNTGVRPVNFSHGRTGAAIGSHRVRGSDERTGFASSAQH